MYIIGVGTASCLRPFHHRGHNGMAVSGFPDSKGVNHILDKIGLIVFPGGADINPVFYNQNRLNDVTGRPVPRQDDLEAAWFMFGLQRKLPMTGICRGMQLGCALSGGSLYQDVTGHTRPHEIVTYTGEVLKVNSIHHQMCYFDNIEHKLLAWSNGMNSAHYLFDRSGENPPAPKPKYEPEAVWFPKTRFLGVQYHPEMMHQDDDGFVFYQDLLDEFVFTTKKEKSYEVG